MCYAVLKLRGIRKSMKNQKKDNENVIAISLLISVLSLVVLCLFAFEYTDVLNTDKDGLAYIEQINSEIQRLSKFELENPSNDDMINSIDAIVSELFSDDEQLKYFTIDDKMTEIIENLINEWGNLKQSIIIFRETGDRELFILSSENNYDETYAVIETINKYINNLTNIVIALQLLTAINVIATIVLLIKILNNNILEIQKGKEAVKKMGIDSVTGLYDELKCQEVLDSEPILKNHKERAFVVLDIDSTDNELISMFAMILKQAIKVSPYETFCGRSDGDKFMVFFPVAEEKDIEIYIEELNFACKEFNEDEKNKVELNFSVGYAITTPKTKLFTNRQLFDIANQYMFEHKIAMQEIRSKEIY